MGICCLQQNYMFLRNNVYRNRTVGMASNAKLRENVVIHEGCRVGTKTEISNSVIGRNCVIGENCVLKNAFLFDGVQIGDKCELQNCVIGRKSSISSGTVLHDGTIIGDSCKLPNLKSLEKAFVVAQYQYDDYDEGMWRTNISTTQKLNFHSLTIYFFSLSSSATYEKIGEHAYIMQLNDGNERLRISGATAASSSAAAAAADSDGEESVGIEWDNLYMKDVQYKYESSIYSSSSEEAEDHRLSPIPDDANS